ncbi:M48 family metallopeptidase [Chryseobacterium sp. SSA4.19]|uniref:M48 family metallopeptidase n=1 Tax=Chryseobacterium sp. SSA4.19 TaxID=2919915 RepID=UPI001F4E1B0C|nr:M48 family metallopeptidase [Chryseobacterium sp. SSA4.19]MCJ8155631.1 M48 family metallopeptidase [Chryseobacterium sp. SSA4.19]
MTNNLPPISAAYRSKLISAITSISVFFIVYFILILISLFLIFLLGYGALQIVRLHSNYITLAIALGLVSVGLVVFYYLIKFIFKKNNYSNKHFIEITHENQPELFSLIDEVVKETGVNKPGKVFLSSEVNASVSYNSVFWSMFLPVKKNITIGMGLINTTTVGELKTVLAHEFGHFSQKSMKIGGYVSQAEKIIFDTVYNNKDFENSLKYNSAHWIFQLSASVSIAFINVFQYVLKLFSDFLFKNNASLRREMEFHADSVATYVTNPKEQASALLRLSLSDTALNSALVFYAESNQAYYPENIFENQTALMRILSERNSYPYENNLPKVNLEDLVRYNKTKIEIEDQWSFHPENDKRIEMIWKNRTKNIPENNDLAKNIIRGFDEVCKVLTEKYLALYDIENTGETITDNERFVQLYNKSYPFKKISSAFNGYYESHNPVLENIEDFATAINNTETYDFFNDENISLVYEKAGIRNDLYTLQYLAANPKTVKTFKCNGKLYKNSEAKILIPRFTKNFEALNTRLAENDKKIFTYYYNKADENDKKTLVEKYKKFAILDHEFEQFQNSINNFVPHLQFVSITLPVEEIRKHRAVLLKNEKPFKAILKRFSEESGYRDLLSVEDRQIIKDFINSEYIYFNNDRYIQSEIDAVFYMVNRYQEIINICYTDYKEALIDFQIRLDEAS